MIINRLILKNFGKFQNREILLKEGINVICGANESGKSTLHTFLQGIFFGMKRMRGRASKTDIYTRYTPWENPGWYEGKVTFTCGGKKFRLERNFGKNMEEARLFCETDGELLSVEDGDLDMLLGNISESVYRNTVSIGQAKSRTEEELYREIRDYLSDFQGSGDLRFNPERAWNVLKEKKKSWEKKEEEARYRREKEEEKLGYRIRHEEEEIENLEEKLEETKRLIQLTKTAQTSPNRKKEIGPAVRSASLLLPAVLLVLAAFGKLPWILVVPGLLLVLAADLYLVGKEKKVHKNILPESEKWKERFRILTENLEERRLCLENLKEEQEEFRADIREITDMRREIRCVEEAEKHLKEAVKGMQNLTGNLLQKKVSEIFMSMTEGKYRGAILDEDFHISLDTGDKILGLHQVSFGTAEQVYFALRMACAEILCREEEFPLLLDETFAMYDDKRLFQTLKWMSRRKSQVILFSCNKREIRALEQMDVPFHLVNL